MQLLNLVPVSLEMIVESLGIATHKHDIEGRSQGLRRASWSGVGTFSSGPGSMLNLGEIHYMGIAIHTALVGNPGDSAQDRSLSRRFHHPSGAGWKGRG